VRPDYVEKLWSLVNWTDVKARFDRARFDKARAA
jgi:Fe-Mn family superoxide dismutase